MLRPEFSQYQGQLSFSRTSSQQGEGKKETPPEQCEFCSISETNGAQLFRETYNKDQILNIPGLPPWRSLYRVKRQNTHFYLANGGFPIDFSGNIDPIPPNKIQLTRALLLQAAIQATITKETGLIDLDPTMQVNIINEYLKMQH